MKKPTLAILGLVAITSIAACSEAVPRESTCQLMTDQICSEAAEAQLGAGVLPVNVSSHPTEAQVIPLVVPIQRKDGDLAAEVDCFVKIDLQGYSVVRSRTAIPPSSPESVDFLEVRHLCTESESYAQNWAVQRDTLLRLH